MSVVRDAGSVAGYGLDVDRADYQREWRARHGARTGQPGPPPVKACGTYAAYKRHERRGETPCDACRDAYRAYQRALYAAKKTERARRVQNPRSS